MKKKFRLYNIDPFDQKTYQLIKQLVQKNSFSEDKKTGYIFDRTNSDLEAIFIEKTIVSTEVISPLGNAIHSELVSFVETKFKAQENWPLFQISSGFRNTNKLLNHIALATDFSIAIEEERFSIRKFLSEIKKEYPDLKVVSLTIKNLQIDAFTSAHMEISSNSNALERAIELIGKRKHQIQKVKCNWISDGLECSTCISSDGQFSLDSSNIEHTYDTVLKAAFKARLA